MRSFAASPFSRLLERLGFDVDFRLRGEDRLSVDELRTHLSYDPETGFLTWLDRPQLRPCVNARVRFKKAGKEGDGYVRVGITVDGVECYFLGHRIAWALMTGEWPDCEIDHRDRNGLNNRWDNLRPASSQENKFNTAGWKNKSLPKGVFYDKRRERLFASCRHDGRNKFLGYYSTTEEAKAAYDTFVMGFQGDFAHLTDSPMRRLLRRLRAASQQTPVVIQGKRPESMLRSYQRYLADCIFEMPAVLGAAEMSLGKTGATLTGARRLLRANPGWRALIVAPLEVAKSTWPDEIAEWEHLQDVTYSVVVGTPEQRLAALNVDCDFTIINRENLAWAWKTVGGAIGWRWQILIYDESSRLKGFTRRTAGSEKTKPQLSEFGVLAAARARIQRVVELSGTPAPNGLIDLGGQAYILDQGKRLGRTKSDFQARWFDKNPYTFEITPKPHAEAEIMAKMKDVMIGLRSEDYIDLPPRHFNPVMVKLPPKLMREYREFEETLVAEAYDVEAVNSGVLTNKLLQFTNGGLYRGDPNDPDAPRETIAIHDLKLKALESIIAEAAGKPVLIGYSFQFDKERIMKRFPKATYFKDDPNFVKNWNAGKIQIGLAHPASIGHGLNLQHGGFIQVWFGLTWSLELWDQFNRRLARPGQKAPTVFIHVIMAKGTEDERQYASLKRKGADQDSITQAVRVRLIEKAA